MSEVGIPVGEAAIMYRLAGREYPLRTVAQCKTCMSPYRSEVEHGLLRSMGYAQIARSLPEGAGLTSRNIMDHVHNGHMPLSEGVKRVMIEDRAKELGRNIEDYEGALADHMTLAKMGIQKVLERLALGEIEPDMKDGIALANFMLKAEEIAGGEIDQQVMMQGFVAWMQAIRKHTDPATFRAISVEISGNPVIRSLMEGTQPEPIEATAKEEEIVHE